MVSVDWPCYYKPSSSVHETDITILNASVGFSNGALFVNIKAISSKPIGLGTENYCSLLLERKTEINCFAGQTVACNQPALVLSHLPGPIAFFMEIVV